MNTVRTEDERNGYRIAQSVELKTLELLFAMRDHFGGILLQTLKMVMPDKSDDYRRGYMLGIIDRDDVKKKWDANNIHPKSEGFEDIRAEQEKKGYR